MAPINNKSTTSRTTVLDKGVVESRGMGSKDINATRETISQEIVEFLQGEAKVSIKAETRSFFTVWTFITRLPGPSWVDLHPGYLMRGMTYFPLAGCLVGLFCGVFYDVMDMFPNTPTTVSSAFSLAASLWVTGCFHEDGLADSGDGVGGGWSKSQILRIMTDSRLGTYGVSVLSLYLMAKLHLLAGLGSSEWSLSNSSGAAPALLVSHAMARLSAPYLIRTNDYVDEGGPKYEFYSFMLQSKYLVTWWRVGFAVLTCMCVGTLVFGWQVAMALIGGVWIVSHFAGRYASYKLGGVMGDYLGATICITELVVLTMLVLKDSFVRTVTDIYEQLLVVYHYDQQQSSFISLLLVENDKFAVIVRFVAVIGSIILWNKLMAPVDFFDREIETEIPSSEGGEQKVAAAATDDGDRSKAELVCQNNDSTFSDRHKAIHEYLDVLAKPMGSLGTLEEWAARLGALQRTTRPRVDPTNDVACIIFAADHGVAKSVEEGGEGCSAYPQVVTRGVVQGLIMEGAGASVLAKSNNVQLRVVDVGVAGESFVGGSIVVESPGKLHGGTRNSCQEPAMTAEEVERLLVAGRQAVKDYLQETNARILCLGEVGIGNTTTSSILLAALSGEEPEKLVDGGATTGRAVDPAVVQKKLGLVKKAMKRHAPKNNSNISSILAQFGGAELVAIVGAIQEASEQNVGVVVDGFIVTVAALAAALLSPSTVRVMFFSTKSSERGHIVAIEKIQDVARDHSIPIPSAPALAMHLRMGEATGALLAVPLLRSATTILTDMATLQDILSA